MKPSCPACGHIHASNDARAVGRFTGTVRFVAAHAETPMRATRAEAEADECAWRRGQHRPSSVVAPVAHAPQESATPSEPAAPFPAALMEEAARAKAWRDFLAQVRLSLLVWDIDGDVRQGCPHILMWISQCRSDLEFGGAP